MWKKIGPWLLKFSKMIGSRVEILFNISSWGNWFTQISQEMQMGEQWSHTNGLKSSEMGGGGSERVVFYSLSLDFILLINKIQVNVLWWFSYTNWQWGCQGLLGACLPVLTSRSPRAALIKTQCMSEFSAGHYHVQARGCHCHTRGTFQTVAGVRDSKELGTSRCLIIDCYKAFLKKGLF